MSMMVQLRGVPDVVHRRLKARAALEGISMSEFVLRELRKALDRPSRQEMIDRLVSRRRARLPTSAAALLRAERDAR